MEDRGGRSGESGAPTRSLIEELMIERFGNPETIEQERFGARKEPHPCPNKKTC
jgi:hypothetical protein